MSEWRPIETAPRDGTKFLAWANNGRHVIGVYEYVPFRDLSGHAHAVLDQWAGRWYRADWWMPLPPPPTNDKEPTP